MLRGFSWKQGICCFSTVDHGVNFTLFSAHAERVELCVFDSRGNERRYDLPGRRGDVWHGY
ncbi:hypothetical protein MJN51_33500, partial [Salmonella enterica subsp. enterica serovar Kentucky]|nr:hypothetical protein [Salmonella enterica subsp. enterica serovar Kentucky]